MLLLALMFYLHYEAPEDEQNFPMVMEMIRAGEVREDDEAFQSPLDILFRKLEMKKPPRRHCSAGWRNWRALSGRAQMPRTRRSFSPPSIPARGWNMTG